MTLRAFNPDDESCGADVDLELGDAVRFHDIERVKSLLQAGANPSAIGTQGEPVLLTALMNQNERLAVLLAEAGADPNLYTRSGEPALSIAIGFEFTNAVDALIAAGADVNLTSGDFTTPLSTAQQRGCDQIANTLRLAGGTIHPADPHFRHAHESSRLFENGETYDHLVPYDKDVESALRSLQKQIFERGEFFGAEHIPASIQDALTQMGETGTRSILDIAGISSFQRVGFAALLSAQELHTHFGTSTPTREQVLASEKFWENLPRGCCRYLVLHDENRPAEILFVGLVFD